MFFIRRFILNRELISPKVNSSPFHFLCKLPSDWPARAISLIFKVPCCPLFKGGAFWHRMFHMPLFIHFHMTVFLFRSQTANPMMDLTRTIILATVPYLASCQDLIIRYCEIVIPDTDKIHHHSFSIENIAAARTNKKPTANKDFHLILK